MKTELTTEQSQRLISLGVPEEKATSVEFYGAYKTKPIFKLTDLLKILPKEIEGKYGLTPIVMTFGGIYKTEEVNKWFAYYDDVIETLDINAEELVDALYELTIWCIENKHIELCQKKV